jgi:hypothetical protein
MCLITEKQFHEINWQDFWDGLFLSDILMVDISVSAKLLKVRSMMR